MEMSENDSFDFEDFISGLFLLSLEIKADKTSEKCSIGVEPVPEPEYEDDIDSETDHNHDFVGSTVAASEPDPDETVIFDFEKDPDETVIFDFETEVDIAWNLRLKEGNERGDRKLLLRNQNQ
jgi:hypothetical protein